jgi:hypothetical protein
MARYFFHLTNEDTIADEVGEEFDLVEEARGHALAVARELSRNAPPHRFAGHHISVVDAGRGRLHHAFTSCGGPRCATRA